jgi:hypothetical protein
MEKNMSTTHVPTAEILTTEQMYERSIRDLNKQLYEAYKRIVSLQEELEKEREKNGKD